MKLYMATKTTPPYGKLGARSYSFKRTQKTDVYDAIVAAGAEGITRPDIAKKVNLAADRISFYLSDLRRSGFIAVKGSPVDLSLMDEQEAAFYAMEALENALVAKAKKLYTLKDSVSTAKATEMERSFVKYNKIKALALRGSTAGEVGVALRMSLLELVKLVF